jgi:hypothetical protein
LAPCLQQPCHYATVTPQANRIETHQIWCLPSSGAQLAFPFAQQIFAVRRIVQPTDRVQKASDEIVYGITAIPPREDRLLNACNVLGSFRTHWSIEAKSHARRDKSFQEDSCQVRNHNAARVLVAFRQMAIFLCEMNAHPTRLQKDQRCLPELFRYGSFNGMARVLSWFLRPKAFKT